MHRFYVDPGSVRNGTVELKGHEYNHLVNVLRIQKGEKVAVSDNSGKEYICELHAAAAGMAILNILSETAGDLEPAVKIDLYQAIPKSDKMDYIIQKSVELGVYGIHPVMTQRVIARIEKDKEKAKLERWNRISVEAAKQSGRSMAPVVGAVMGFEDAIEAARESSFCVFPYENETGRMIRDLDLSGSERISVFIGPEGGFDDGEVNMAVARGILPVSLGKRILRTETASIAVLSILMHIKGEM